MYCFALERPGKSLALQSMVPNPGSKITMYLAIPSR